MNFENFNLAKIKTLSPIDAQNYIIKYFVPLSNGNHVQLVDGKYEIKEDAVIKKTFFKRMPIELTKFYFTDYTEVKSVTYELNKPTFIDDKINLCPTFKHQYKPYNEMPENIKKGVNSVLNFLKNVWCRGNDESYNFLIKWISNMLKGNKNNSCLYLKGPQGLGKSTIGQFLRDHVIGHGLTLETGSKPLKSNFNIILGGKLLVIFEELENFSVNEWQGISSVLKRHITSNMIELEEKNISAYPAKNMNNYILISNNDAIKDDEGRRYFILDLSTKYIGNIEFFNNFYKECFNDDIGYGFFCYMMEIDTTKFNPQDYPITQSKLDAVAKKLDSVYEFLKFEFIAKKTDFKGVVQELHDEYKLYCINNHIKSHHKIDFNKKLDEVGIIDKKSNKVNKYNVKYSDLVNLAKRNNWIHKLDEIEIDDVEPSTPEPEKILKTEYDEALKQIDGLTLKLAEMEEEKDKEIENLKSQLKKALKKPKNKAHKQEEQPKEETKKTAFEKMRDEVIIESEDDEETLIELSENISKQIFNLI